MPVPERPGVLWVKLPHAGDELVVMTEERARREMDGWSFIDGEWQLTTLEGAHYCTLDYLWRVVRHLPPE